MFKSKLTGQNKSILKFYTFSVKNFRAKLLEYQKVSEGNQGQSWSCKGFKSLLHL